MVLESALEGEMSDHLGYPAGDPAGRNGGNSRNGHRPKTVLTEIGPVDIEVPRDRQSSFEPKIVRKRQRRLTGVEDIVISLSAKGLTTGEVAAHLAEIYGAEVSRQTMMGFATKRDAVAAMSALQAELGDGTHVEASKLTVGEYLTGWLKLAKLRLRPGSYDACAIHVNRYIVPHIGGLRLQALSARGVKQFYAELATSGRIRGVGGLSEKSIHNIHTTLSRALRDAVSDRLLPRNPAAGAHQQPESPEQATWKADELAEFLAFVEGDRLSAMWRLLALTGMRRGEICGLRRRDLDLDHARLFVVQQRAKGGGTVHTGKTKGRRGRPVALDGLTVEALRAHLRTQAIEHERLGLGYTDHGLVFCHEDGKPLHPDSVTKRFARLVRDSGLPTITAHGLQHTHATLLPVCRRAFTRRLSRSASAIRRSA